MKKKSKNLDESNCCCEPNENNGCSDCSEKFDIKSDDGEANFYDETFNEQKENGCCCNHRNSLQDESKSQIEQQLEEKMRQNDEYLLMLQRTAAEFDNFKKRTIKEKESFYKDTVGEVVEAFLPVVDNLERAILAVEVESGSANIKEGIEMVYRQMKDVLKKFGVDEILSVGASFDPNIHNAVMHVQDDAFGEGEIVEEFQKGYIIKDKVIRHSMVKVAN